MLFSKIGVNLALLILIFPALFMAVFFYFMKLPDVKIIRRSADVNREIVYAGRFLIIELESGVPMYDAFKNVAKHYPIVGSYFKHITEQIDLGTQAEDAINLVLELTPSQDLRKILWQILNSMVTGANVSNALRSVVENIVKEQQIELKEYGRKLNPLAMFFMIIAIILPSIGIMMFVVLASFMSIQITLSSFMIIALFLGFIQFFFYQTIKASRPAGQFE